jgi:hypothetical protein
MIFKNKKAQGGPQWTLIEYILAIIALGIMIIIVLRITGFWPSAVTESTCEASVYARSSALLKGGIGGVSPELVSLKCATQYKCFTAGGKCPSGYDKVTVANDNEIKQKLAEEMYLCWKMLGQGKIRFVSDSTFSQRACLPCSIITFDDKLKGRQITGFQTYLAITNTSSGMTYMQYLTNAKEIETAPSTAGIIDTSKDYAVIFSLYKAEYFSERAGLLAGGTAAVGTGVGIGILAAKGSVVGFALLGPAGLVAGAGIGTGVGLLTYIGTSKFMTLVKASKETIPSISLDEYSAEALKDCKSFVNI